MAERDEFLPDFSFEMIDVYTWEKYDKIITQDVHKIPGLGNFTHFSRTTSRPPSPPHYHKELMELHCVVKGRRYSRVYAPDGSIQDHVCIGNEALIFYPGETHSSGASSQDPCESYALQLNIDKPENFLGLDPVSGSALCKQLKDLGSRHLAVEKEGLQLLKKAFQLTAQRNYESAAAHIVCFLYEFVTMPVLDELPRQPGDPRIRRAIEYIEANVTEPISLTELAKLTGYSLSRFKTLFREETGRTPGSYITSAKVEKAKTLLTETERSVTEIALDLSWSSGNYFCTVFKNLTGLSPLQYRKNR